MSDKCGSDQDGDGTEQKPFKTPLKVNAFGVIHHCSLPILNTSQCFIVRVFPFQALFFAGKEPFPTIYVDSQKEGEVNN